MEELTEQEKDIMDNAIFARNKRAFAPKSNYKVGVCVMTNDGSYYNAGNVEFARSLNIHAEVLALADALASGNKPEDIIAMAECFEAGEGPCGPCLQYMIEVNKDMMFYGVHPDGKLITKKKITELYPYYYRSNDAKH